MILLPHFFLIILAAEFAQSAVPTELVDSISDKGEDGGVLSETAAVTNTGVDQHMHDLSVLTSDADAFLKSSRRRRRRTGSADTTGASMRRRRRRRRRRTVTKAPTTPKPPALKVARTNEEIAVYTGWRCCSPPDEPNFQDDECDAARPCGEMKKPSKKMRCDAKTNRCTANNRRDCWGCVDSQRKTLRAKEKLEGITVYPKEDGPAKGQWKRSPDARLIGERVSRYFPGLPPKNCEKMKGFQLYAPYGSCTWSTGGYPKGKRAMKMEDGIKYGQKECDTNPSCRAIVCSPVALS